MLGKVPNSPFPNLMRLQDLLFWLYLRKFVNLVFFASKKGILQSLKLIFPVILRIFDLECDGTPLVCVFHVWSHFHEIEKIGKPHCAK